MTHWFAVFTNAQKEQLASRRLRERGFEVFFPHTSHWVDAGHKAKSRLVKRAWLSRYLFVKCSKENLWAVNDVDGVSTVVRAPGGEPHPVPSWAMEALMAQADHLGEVFIGRLGKVKSPFKSGQVIRLLDEKSPLFGLYFQVAKVLDNGNVCGTLLAQIAGASNTILSAPVVGEVVEGAA